MKEPLISIIVPIYKVEKYIKFCLDSIVNQTYKNLEIILVDDGSPDACPTIIDKYAKLDKRIKILHKTNGGLSSARNAGLDIMRGDYVAFVDSDDIISPYFIEHMLDTSIKTKADIVQCDVANFTDDEQNRLSFKTTEFSLSEYTNIEALELIYKDNDYRNIVVWNKLYKSRIYKDLRFPVGKINEDEFCTYKAFDLANKVTIISETLYFYRKSENSIMGRKFNIKRLDIIDAMKERIDYFYDRNYDALYFKALNRFHVLLKKMYILTIENIDDKEEKKKALKLIKESFKWNFDRIKRNKMFNLRHKIVKWFIANFCELYFFIFH